MALRNVRSWITARHTAPGLRVGAFLLAVAVGLPGCAWIEGLMEGDGVSPVGYGPSSGPSEAGAESDRISGAPLIRVGLAHNVLEAEVSSRAAFTLTVFADTVTTRSLAAGGRWRFRAVKHGVEVAGRDERLHVAAGTIRISADGPSLLSVGGVTYRGEIEVFPSSPGSLSVGNIVSIESYLRGVVPLEIGRRAPEELEAVKAQAVAARTYAVASSGSRARGSFDVFPTVEDQVYGGVDVEEPVSWRAITETAGLIAEYDGEPILAYFHSSCGGRTEARGEVWELPDLPYIESIRDTPGGSRDLELAYCRNAADFTWSESWSGQEIADIVERHLPAVASTPVGQPLGRVRDLRVTARTPSGRVRWLEVETDGGIYRVFGDRTRWLLRRPGTARILRSSWFELDVERRGRQVTGVIAEGRGHGHGVGMCQHGALEMARQGYSYEEILRHYYPGVELTRAYEIGGGDVSGEPSGDQGDAGLDDPATEQNDIDTPGSR